MKPERMQELRNAAAESVAPRRRTKKRPRPSTDRNRDRQKARQRAFRRLAAAHVEEYELFFDEELRGINR